MRCEDARFALAANPQDADAALAEHLQGCAACAKYAEEMRTLDRRLLAAMRVPVPATVTNITPRVRRRGPMLALAASVAAAAVLAGLLWSAFPRESLADAVVGHMGHEPKSWTLTTPLPAAEVDRTLARAGVRLAPGSMDVTYANACWFRGEFVPHLVVRTAGGPVTVMVLPRERIERPQSFDEGGYRGMLVAAPRGSVAVVDRGNVDIDAAARQALAALEYR